MGFEALKNEERCMRASVNRARVHTSPDNPSITVNRLETIISPISAPAV